MITFLMAAALSAAAPTTAQPVAAPAKAVKDPSEVICRFENIPGTRMRHKVCKTRAELQAEQDARDRYFRDADDRQGLTPAAPPPAAMGSGN